MRSFKSRRGEHRCIHAPHFCFFQILQKKEGLRCLTIDCNAQSLDNQDPVNPLSREAFSKGLTNVDLGVQDEGRLNLSLKRAIKLAWRMWTKSMGIKGFFGKLCLDVLLVLVKSMIWRGFLSRKSPLIPSTKIVHNRGYLSSYSMLYKLCYCEMRSLHLERQISNRIRGQGGCIDIWNHSVWMPESMI